MKGEYGGSGYFWLKRCSRRKNSASSMAVVDASGELPPRAIMLPEGAIIIVRQWSKGSEEPAHTYWGDLAAARRC